MIDSLDQRAKLLKARGEKFVAAAMSPDEKTDATLLQGLMVAEALKKTASDGFALQVKVVSGGRTSLIKTNFFRTKFEFSGGAFISYMLINSEGAVAACGTFMEYGGSIDAIDIRSLLPPTK